MTYETQTPFGSLPPERNPIYKTKQRNNLARIGFAMLAFLLLTSFVQAAMMAAVEWLAPAFYETEVFNWLLVTLPSYGVGLPFFYLFLAGMPKKHPERKTLGKENALAFLTIAFFLMVAGNFIALSLMDLFETLRGEAITNAVENYMESYSPLISFVTMVILAPIFEELMFRKLVIDRLLPYSEMLAVVTSGLFFGLLHGNFYQFFYATMLGMLFGIVYVKTGKLRYTILMHAIINFTGTTVSAFFAEVTSEEVMLKSSINPWVTVSGAYSMALFLLAVCGLLFLIRKRKEITLSKTGERYLTLKTQFKLTWGNVGTIVFCIVSAITFMISLFL